MKIYTKTGDAGTTSLVGGERVSKAHPRIATYGNLDELNACIGLAIAHLTQSQKQSNEWQLLTRTQHQIFNMGSRLACANDEMRNSMPEISETLVSDFEKTMDDLTAKLPELREFILPGGSPAASHLHLARTLCRRAERNLIDFLDKDLKDCIEIQLLNRLSDFLFVLSRWANHQADIPDTTWKKDS